MKFNVRELIGCKKLQHSEKFDPKSFLPDPPDLVNFNDPVQVHAEAVLVHEDILISGDASTTMELVCGRCLNRFSLPLEASFHTNTDLNHTVINISKEIRDALFTEVPPYPICDKNCVGVHQEEKYGSKTPSFDTKEKGHDPRWDALKKVQ